jgi:hypothetical protein
MQKASLLAAVLSIAVTPASFATQVMDPSASDCTTPNCSSVRLGGVANGFNVHKAAWTIEIFAAPGQCLRMVVIDQPPDAIMQIVAVRPDGTVYRDDGGGDGIRPIVKINDTQSGWYAVSVTPGQPVENAFTFAFGRYNLNNPNCDSPTPPLTGP